MNVVLLRKIKEADDNLKDTDYVFIYIVIFFVILILWTITYSCYYYNSRPPHQHPHQFNFNYNPHHINHQSIDSGFGKLYHNQITFISFHFYNCFIFQKKYEENGLTTTVTTTPKIGSTTTVTTEPNKNATVTPTTTTAGSTSTTGFNCLNNSTVLHSDQRVLFTAFIFTMLFHFN